MCCSFLRAAKQISLPAHIPTLILFVPLLHPHTGHKCMAMEGVNKVGNSVVATNMGELPSNVLIL